LLGFDLLLNQVRFGLNIRAFLRSPTSPAEARRQIETRLRERESSFLDLMERAVYANTSSPYLKLLRHAGIELDDLRRCVHELGLQGTLEYLHEAGVYITLEELKGRQPVRRDGLEFVVAKEDFDNPLVRVYRERVSSGSRGTPTRIKMDWGQVRMQSSYMAPVFESLGVPRPFATWLPGGGGAWFWAQFGLRLERSFAMHPESRSQWSRRLTNVIGPAASRVIGIPFVPTEHVPLDQAVTIARWLAEKKQQGPPAIVTTLTSPALHICRAALDNGLDIAGSTFIFGGEPYTPAKAEQIARVGARALSAYHMVEIGAIGETCLAPAIPDETHLLSDKVAFIQRAKPADSSGVRALYYTATAVSTPKIMINAESGDYADISTRDCGCIWQELGLTTHLSNIRSYEKLTSESVTFLGSELLDLLENDLPARFGGAVTDYQLVEEEDMDTGLPRVSIVVSPAVGEVDEAALIETVLARLRRSNVATGRWAALWQQAGTLRVVRRQPYTSGSTKIQPLHVLTPTR
jgi:hypothetical protein